MAFFKVNFYSSLISNKGEILDNVHHLQVLSCDLPVHDSCPYLKYWLDFPYSFVGLLCFWHSGYTSFFG